MRYLWLWVFAAVLWALSGQHATAAEVKAAKYQVGKAVVWAIADSTGNRDTSVFSGAAPEVLAQYMPSGKSPTAVMAFLVKVGHETVLIDTGLGAPSGSRASQLTAGLRQAETPPEDVTLVLVTHMHGDHIGGLTQNGGRAFPSARVLSAKTEHDFWLDEKSPERFPSRKAGFEMARSVLGLYGSASETFEFDAIVASGIQALDARGHTPGHTAFLLESDGEKMLFWGDLVHAATLQFARPDINSQYDMNPEESAVTRTRFMEKAAAEKLPIAGAHLPFPGVGTVEKNPAGGYVYNSR
ncbi:MAG: MBL fold metallo-hydrolase [Synergistaceae bacterium]|nr:MBL fold metallo-hydrolase [Synergistaceae bacterium]